jgi:hypothetical protein
MASHVNLFTLLGNASEQYVTGAGLYVHVPDSVQIELINLVFRVLELREILIPQDPVGYDRSPNIVRDPHDSGELVDHPDDHYIQDPGRYTGYYMTNPSPRGYFRDMLQYACSNEQHGLLKRLLATSPARFESGMRPSLQDCNELKCAADSVDLEAVRVLLAADRDWKLGTDPIERWPLSYVASVQLDLKEEYDCYADDEDLSNYTDMCTILGLLVHDRRNRWDT